MNATKYRNQQLTPEEHADLFNCEQAIKENLDGFMKAGLALIQIRDQQLYRGQFGNFDEYCRTRWGFSRAHAYRLIDAAAVSRNIADAQIESEVSPIGDKLEVTSESQARELGKVEPDQQAQVFAKAAKKAKRVGRPTAKEIREVIEEEKPQVKTALESMADRRRELFITRVQEWRRVGDSLLSDFPEFAEDILDAADAFKDNVQDALNEKTI